MLPKAAFVPAYVPTYMPATYLLEYVRKVDWIFRANHIFFKKKPFRKFLHVPKFGNLLLSLLCGYKFTKVQILHAFWVMGFELEN